MAEKLALRASADNIFNFIEITPEYSIFEIPTLNEWIGKTIGSVNVRRKYGINVLTVKKFNSEVIMPSADYLFEKDDHVIIMGKKNDVIKFISK